MYYINPFPLWRGSGLDTTCRFRYGFKDIQVPNHAKYTQTSILENVEHCGGEPEQADTGYYVIDR